MQSPVPLRHMTNFMITKIWHQTSTNVQLLQKEDYETNDRNSSTTCTNPIIHLFNPPKICIGIVFDFPLLHLHVPGELANNDYAKFWGSKRGVLWDCASSEFLVST